MSKEKETKTGKRIKSLDFFGQSPGFMINGASRKGTYLGALLSLVVLILTLSYGIRQAEVMINLADTAHQTAIEDLIFLKDDPFRLGDSRIFMGWNLKEANKLAVHTVDTHGYVEFQLRLLEIDYR